MEVLSRKNIIPFAAIVYFFYLLQSAAAEAIINPECTRLKMIGPDHKRMEDEFKRIKADDKAQLCPLSKRIIESNEEMIKIFESDSNHCGVTNGVVERLKTSTETLRVLSSANCR